MRLISYALRRSGYEVISAESGEEGVELAASEKPYLILVDVNLPGIDGLETTRRIRNSAADSQVPIIAITSHAMYGDRDRILQAGCNAYFEKPIDPLTIIKSILAAIGVQSE
jgi:CheY-like chemotaxis protein